MLEQLLMNCKFETLQKILNIVYADLQDTGISINEFDKIIRFYSKKALDFRVSLQRDGIDNKSRSMQDSNLENESNEFMMPSKVPTKEEWVPNDKVYFWNEAADNVDIKICKKKKNFFLGQGM